METASLLADLVSAVANAVTAAVQVLTGRRSERRTIGAMSWNLTVHLKSGSTRVLNFETEDEAKQQLAELHAAMTAREGPTRIADRLLVDATDVESAEVVEDVSGPMVG